jgi:hypothetical protein
LGTDKFLATWALRAEEWLRSPSMLKP